MQENDLFEKPRIFSIKTQILLMMLPQQHPHKVIKWGLKIMVI